MLLIIIVFLLLKRSNNNKISLSGNKKGKFFLDRETHLKPLTPSYTQREAKFYSKRKKHRKCYNKDQNEGAYSTTGICFLLTTTNVTETKRNEKHYES